MTKNVDWSSRKVTLLLDFNRTWIFSTYFRKILGIQYLIKIIPVVAELFHADRQTDMTKLTGAFHNFVKSP